MLEDRYLFVIIVQCLYSPVICYCEYDLWLIAIKREGQKKKCFAQHRRMNMHISRWQIDGLKTEEGKKN